MVIQLMNFVTKYCQHNRAWDCNVCICSEDCEEMITVVLKTETAILLSLLDSFILINYNVF